MQPTMPERKFEIGQKVMAKWPKSTLYFKAEIIDFNDIEYLVKFDDEKESELTVKYKDVSLPFTRSRSRSVGRSPNKRASKSPSRRSPSRKSPGRVSEARVSSGRSPGRPKEVKKISPEENVRISRKETHEESSYSKIIKNDSSPELKNRSETSSSNVRQSARIAAIEKKISYSEATKMNSNSIKVDAKSIVKSVQDKNQFVEYIKRILLCIWATSKVLPFALLVSTFPFALTLLCTAKKCDLKLPEIPRNLSNYYDQRASLITAGFVFTCLLLALLPIGRVAKTKTGARVRCNGFLTLIVGAIGAGVLLYLKFNIASIYFLLRHILVTLTAFGAVLSVLLYIKSFYARRDTLNPEGRTGYYIVDLIEGRETTPRIGSFDIKFFLLRLGMLIALFICFLIVGKDLQAEKYSIPLMISVGMKVFYIMDLILYEDSFLTSFEYLSVGTGYLNCVGYLTMPFLYTVDNRYILNNKPEMPWYCLAGIVCLFLIGYSFLRGSNSQKHAFRTNPADPALAHLESLPTSTGKRLLMSGWWGIVRHPNYFGDILVQTAMALLCGFHHAVPWVVYVFSVFYLCVRMFEVESTCKSKYGLAWSSYTARVPYRLIPKVF